MRFCCLASNNWICHRVSWLPAPQSCPWAQIAHRSFVYLPDIDALDTPGNPKWHGYLCLGKRTEESSPCLLVSWQVCCSSFVTIEITVLNKECKKSQYGIRYNLKVKCTKRSDVHNSIFKQCQNDIEICTSQLQLSIKKICISSLQLWTFTKDKFIFPTHVNIPKWVHPPLCEMRI